MDINKLKDLVKERKSQRSIAKHLSCSQSTIKYWLRKLELKTFKASLDNNCKCTACGQCNVNNFYKNNKRLCKTCRNKKSSLQSRKNRQKMVSYKGGSCEICGYNKCLGALEFHHKDPTKKDPKWQLVKNWRRNTDRIKAELDKCQLLCANCHRELHYNQYQEFDDKLTYAGSLTVEHR